MGGTKTQGEEAWKGVEEAQNRELRKTQVCWFMGVCSDDLPAVDYPGVPVTSPTPVIKSVATDKRPQAGMVLQYSTSQLLQLNNFSAPPFISAIKTLGLLRRPRYIHRASRRKFVYSWPDRSTLSIPSLWSAERTATTHHHNNLHERVACLRPLTRAPQPAQIHPHLKIALFNTRSLNNKGLLLTQPFSFNIDGSIVTPSTQVRNLGIILDPTLSFLPHANHITKTAFFYLRNIARLRPSLRAMEKFEEEVKELIQTRGPAEAAAKIKTYLDEQKNILVNIGITGETGSGKSTFVNAFRGLADGDEGAALTDVVETTTVVTPYPHPHHPNVVLWDLPGIGTTNFPADNYLELVGFEKFDFFIIISASRFTENDAKLAKEIQRMEKKFYFVRSKIDNDVRDDKRRHKSAFNEEQTLDKIRENCIQGVKSQQVFLMSSVELHLYDFRLLEETLRKELPAHKRHALLLALPNVSLGIIRKKKEAFQSQIKWQALLSAGIAAVPVPGVSFAADLTMMVTVIRQYQVSFGLDSSSLENLARSADVPLNDIKAVMTSPLAGNEISKDLIIKLLSTSVAGAALLAAEEGSRLIPLIGIPAAMGLSFICTYNALNTFLTMLAEDAQSVFTKALGLNTSV
ncbi:interferon-inducible GTPase 5-like [Anarhichas minor]|uniref:interferon-inducible GTPase 5-like n=1 Tax=Anarhichas minor TaxID=65739 RepID=UPI003F7379FD